MAPEVMCIIVDATPSLGGSGGSAGSIIRDEGLDLPRQSWLIMVHLRHEVRGDGWFSRLDFSTLMNGLSV